MGSRARYFNNSCSPNAILKEVMLVGSEVRVMPITATAEINQGRNDQNSDSNSSADDQNGEDIGNSEEVEGKASVICKVIGRLHGDEECRDG